MYGHDTNGVRSRYDYYYSVSSPSLSQAANYYENQAGLFGEPIAPLLPPPIQKSPSPQRIQTPLTPFNTHNASTPSSANTNFISSVGVHPPMIENFDNHLYESIRRNILDQHHNNNHVTNALTKHQLWTQYSNSSSNSPPNEPSDDHEHFDIRRKRASTSFGHYKSDDDVSHSKYRSLSASRDASFSLSYHKGLDQLTIENTSDTDNNNGSSRSFYLNNRQNRVVPLDITSNSSSSKLNHSIAHTKSVRRKPPIKPLVKTSGKSTTRPSPLLRRSLSRPSLKPPPVKSVVQKNPYALGGKSKSDLNSLKTYPDSFTILPSPKRSPSAGYTNKRQNSDEEDDDSVMDFEWVKPAAEKLYEAATTGDKYLGEPTFIADHFGQHVSVPTSPIITDKVKIGSSHR